MNIKRGFDRLAFVLAVVAIIPAFIIGYRYAENLKSINQEYEKWTKRPEYLEWKNKEKNAFVIGPFGGEGYFYSENIEETETKILEIKRKYPEYYLLSYADKTLPNKLYKEHYAEMPPSVFAEHIGLKELPPKPAQYIYPSKIKTIGIGVLIAILLFCITLLSLVGIIRVFVWIGKGFKDDEK